MNRQLRRAQEKAEEKQARDKQKAKAAKRAKRQQRRAKRSEAKKKSAKPAQPAKRRPDLFFRFAGPITIFTTAFIVLQAIAPRPEQGGGNFGLIVEVAYYFIFGYGLCLWLSKRGRENARWLAAGVAVALAAGLQLGAFIFPTLDANLLLLAAGSGLGVLGALAGDWVAKRMM